MSRPRARPQDDEEKRPVSKGGKVAAWILTILLVIGLGGFGVTNFGGTATSVATVGDTRISSQDYARAVQQEIARHLGQIGTRLGITEALAFGLDRQRFPALSPPARRWTTKPPASACLSAMTRWQPK